MRALHGAAADIQRRAHNFIHAERLSSDRGADDVHHRVHRADFVEVDFLDVDVVNLGFGRAQRFEDGNRGLLCAFADARLADDLAYLFQPATMLMCRGCMWRGRPRPRCLVCDWL